MSSMEPDRAALPETVITDEMVRVGVEAYYAADRRVTDIDYVVVAIFRAMLAARPYIT